MRYLSNVHTRTVGREREPNTDSFCLNIMKAEEGKDIRTTFFVEIVKGKGFFRVRRIFYDAFFIGVTFSLGEIGQIYFSFTLSVISE